MVDKKRQLSVKRAAALLALTVFAGGAFAAYANFGRESSVMEWLPASRWGFSSRTMTMNIRETLGGPSHRRRMVARKLGFVQIISVSDP